MNAPETLDERLAARFSVDRAKKLRAEAEEARAGAEALARELADADKVEAAMRAARAVIAGLVAGWRASLPAEMAALESQDAIHARLAGVVHEGLAYVSAQAHEMARALAGEPGSAVDALVAHGGVAYLERLARSVAPRPHLTVSTWADKYRWLSQKGSSEPGKWKTERNPMLREIMDCLSVQSDVRRIVVMKPAQVGVTEACLNWIGYVMQHAPAPIMVLLPTLENRDKWIGQKLNPLLLETPIIAELFDAKRERDASNSRDNKDFPGGVLFLAGGNSPNSYAQVSARYVIMDDLDRFPDEVGPEGHPVALARGRCKAFPRYKMLLISTPTIKEASHIEAEYDKSDQRRYHVPCPHCGEYQVLKREFMKWPDHNATSGVVTNVWYVCSESGCVIEEYQKPEMLARGRWVAARPEVKTRGYHINGLYAPIGLGKTWLELAQEWLDAQKDPVALKTFINTELAETWEDRSHAVKPKHLSERAGPQKAREIPLGCLLLTCGVDTQDDRLEVHVLGHGPMLGHGGAERGLIHWTIDYLVIPGNPAHDAVWETLAQVLNRPYVNARGRELLIEATAIDEGGHHTDDVRWFATQGKAKRTMAVKGMNRASRTIMPGGPKPTDINRLGKRLTGGARTWDVGTDVAKNYLVKNMVADSEQPAETQRIRFHSELEDSFYQMLLAETFDPARNRWVKKQGRRNEALDCFDAETDVLTESGWKRFATVTMADRLATVSLERDQIEYQAPLLLIDKPHDGPMVRIKGERIDVLVTPNHRMVTLKKRMEAGADGKRRWNFDVPAEITLAKDLTVHHALKIRSNWTGDAVATVSIPASVTADTGAEIEPARRVDAGDMAEFMGWWVAEGSAREFQYRGHTRRVVIIAQTKPAMRERIEALLKRLPWAWHAEGGDRYRITSKQLCDYVCQFGRLQPDRIVPGWIKRAQPAIIARFVDAMVLGDGWTQQKKAAHRASRTIATTSPRLADDLQELFIKLGNAATLRVVDPVDPHIGARAIKSARRQYHVYERLASRAHLDGDGDGKRGYIGETVQYSGRVYCATVPNGTLIVRRGGKTFIAGNCWVYGYFAAHHPQIAVARKTRKEWAALAAILEPALQEDGTVPAVAVAKPAAPAKKAEQRGPQQGGRGGDGGFY